MHGGLLNDEVVEGFRTVESGGKRYARTMHPSRSQLHRVDIIVENFAMRGICPLKYYKAADGSEVIQFRAADVLVCAIKASGLWEAAHNRPIELAQSLDGALFSKNLSHVLCGCKVADRGGNQLMQSRNNVFPVW